MFSSSDNSDNPFFFENDDRTAAAAGELCFLRHCETLVVINLVFFRVFKQNFLTIFLGTFI
jgi:hypothetical protein